MSIVDFNRLLTRQNKNIEKQMMGRTKKKRKSLTSGQRLFIWEHPKLYGRKCHICGQKITKQSDLQLDHKTAFSNGGKKLALAHTHCNRIKSSGSLRKIQKALGLRIKRKRSERKKKVRRATRNPYEIKIPQFKI